jgi:rSAM-associated Gly-rich repeat protein
MKPTTLLGTLILLSTWSSVGAAESGTYSVQKADNSIEQRIAAARSGDGWAQLLKAKLHKPLEIAAWANGGYRRGWANGGGGGGAWRNGGGFANAGRGFANAGGGGWRNGSGAWGNVGGRRGFVNW